MAKKYWADKSHYYTISEDGNICWLYKKTNNQFGIDVCIGCTMLYNDDDYEELPVGGLFFPLNLQKN